MIKTAITGIGDPFILRAGDTYYMYATSAPDGFLYFSSTDLLNWKNCGYCFKAAGVTENCYWAPEVYEINGKYYMIYTARWAKNHSLRLWLAVADSPCGPFENVGNEPIFDYGYAVIDGSLFIDDNKQGYLYFSRDCSENIINGVHTSEIYCVKFSIESMKAVGEPVKLTTPDVEWETSHCADWKWNEAPAVLKRNGIYYLCYSVNCFDCREYSVGVAMSDKPMGKFIKYDKNPILKYKENEFSGPGHNCFFTDKDGRLMTAFHIHTDYDKPSGDRRACIAPVRFDGDAMIIDL